MLRSLKDLERYKVSASDGEIGSVRNFLVDDDRWVVRYLVVETGSFFNSRPVLISPISFRRIDWSTHRFHLALTVDKIKNSPGIDVDQSVSRQHEIDYNRYFAYPPYWGFTGYAGVWGKAYDPSGLARRGRVEPTLDAGPEELPGDAHLRSANDVSGYRIHGVDGSIGDVADFVVDDENWQVRYLAIDTSHWWLGKKVLLSPQWVDRVSWGEKAIYLNMTRQAIRESPTWEPSDAVDRKYEAELYDHYGRPSYWTAEDQAEEVTQRQGEGAYPG